jgi:hypothetical protein
MNGNLDDAKIESVLLSNLKLFSKQKGRNFAYLSRPYQAAKMSSHFIRFTEAVS